MTRRSITGATLVALEDQRLREQLRHERDMNHVYERRCPGVVVTKEYERGLRSPRLFYSEAERLRYSIRLEFAKFNPAVRLDLCSKRQPCHEPRVPPSGTPTTGGRDHHPRIPMTTCR